MSGKLLISCHSSPLSSDRYLVECQPAPDSQMAVCKFVLYVCCSVSRRSYSSKGRWTVSWIWLHLDITSVNVIQTWQLDMTTFRYHIYNCLLNMTFRYHIYNCQLNMTTFRYHSNCQLNMIFRYHICSCQLNPTLRYHICNCQLNMTFIYHICNCQLNITTFRYHFCSFSTFISL